MRLWCILYNEVMGTKPECYSRAGEDKLLNWRFCWQTKSHDVQEDIAKYGFWKVQRPLPTFLTLWKAKSMLLLFLKYSWISLTVWCMGRRQVFWEGVKLIKTTYLTSKKSWLIATNRMLKCWEKPASSTNSNERSGCDSGS